MEETIMEMNEMVDETIATEEVKEKKYTFKKLKSTDVFPMFKLLNKIGVKEFKNCFESDTVKNAIKKSMEGGMEGDELAKSVGINVIMEIAAVIFENIPKCEDDIYTMLSSVSNLSKKEIKELEMSEFFEMIIDFIKLDDFKDFIKVVSRLFK